VVLIIQLTLLYYITFDVLDVEIFLDSRLIFSSTCRTKVDEVHLGDNGRSCFDLFDD